jgi:hypothetical protein
MMSPFQLFPRALHRADELAVVAGRGRAALAILVGHWVQPLLNIRLAIAVFTPSM